ncbi:hypothetical protein AB835_14935 [Candidatus Endobugula sertula]|uniref:Uncharacterized protein n=1 Tax=Candidatus Endobugula sertula TaxID=62101 RepID=A0A1D2QL62_9GAMM|nr:hypothetical protein AB835_14935 [Candidatus Endobugula sertula]
MNWFGLGRLTDVIFISVLLLIGIYFLSEAVGLLNLSRDVGAIVVRLFVIGVPLSLALSLVSLINLKHARYKWYSWVSGVEVLILALVFWIFYSSQI